MKEWEYLPFMPGNKPFVLGFVPVCPVIFHAILFGKPFYLSMPEHGQPRKGAHQYTDTKILVAFSKLFHRGFLIGIVHEINEPFQYLGIKSHGVFHHGPVFGVLLIPKHVHERTVIDPVHTQCPDKIAFHEPERFSQ